VLNTTLYGTGLYDTGAPAVEVRVFRADRLVDLELCEDDRQAAEILRRWPEREGFSFLVDDIAERAPDGDVAFAPLRPGPETPIAAAALPGIGIE
jgi:hypothetical protein